MLGLSSGFCSQREIMSSLWYLCGVSCICSCSLSLFCISGYRVPNSNRIRDNHSIRSLLIARWLGCSLGTIGAMVWATLKMGALLDNFSTTQLFHRRQVLVPLLCPITFCDEQTICGYEGRVVDVIYLGFNKAFHISHSLLVATWGRQGWPSGCATSSWV